MAIIGFVQVNYNDSILIFLILLKVFFTVKAGGGKRLKAKGKG